MPTDTFSIAATGDDQWVYKESSVYPPTGTVGRFTATTEIEVSRWNPGGAYRIYNGLLKFDTSALPDDASISSAVLQLYVTAKSSVDSLSFVAEWYTWNSTDSDYTATPSTTAHAGTALGSITSSLSNNFALQNLSNISKTGNTYLRLHISQRTSDAAPSGANYLRAAAYDDTTLTEPRLLVTYAIGGGDLVGQIGI